MYGVGRMMGTVVRMLSVGDQGHVMYRPSLMRAVSDSRLIGILLFPAHSPFHHWRDGF